MVEKKDVICRVCLAKNGHGYMPLSKQFNTELTISDIIRICTDIVIVPGTDKYPQYLCLECLAKLTTSYEIRCKAIASQESLKNDPRFQESSYSDSESEDEDKSWFDEPIFYNGRNINNNKVDMIRNSKVISKVVNDQVDKEHQRKRPIETRRKTVCTYSIMDLVVTDTPIPIARETNWNEENLNEFYCDQCNRQFRNKKNLEAHNKNKHELLVELAPKRSSSVAMVARAGFPCNICSKVLKTLHNLKRHKATIHKNSPAPAKSMIPPALPRAQSMILPVSPEIFICHICDKHFFSNMSLSAHKGYHTRAMKAALPHFNATLPIQYSNSIIRNRANTLI